MARNTKARLDCRALPYLQPLAGPSPPDDPASAFLSSGSGSPVRAAVEMRSDLSFIADTAAALQAAGVENATGIAHAVLTTPTVAARHAGPEGITLLQSAVIAAPVDDFNLQITLRFKVREGKPGSAELITVEQQAVDLDDPSDRRMLVAAVEEWHTEFPMPTTPHPDPLPLRPWAWMGDPTHCGLLETPANWRDMVARLGAVHGVAPLIVDTAERMRTWNIGDRIEHAVIVRGTKWAADFPPESATKDIELAHVGTYGGTFEEALDLVRGDLLTEAVAANTPPPSSRDLKPGEIVYHRKVGNSPKFDRFDDGSTEACTHGAEGFTNWDAEKAIKGMGRRYDNFNPSMLIHCSKYPNCGMYGVDAGRGGLKDNGNG